MEVGEEMSAREKEGPADVRRYLRKSGSELYWGGTWGSYLEGNCVGSTSVEDQQINRTFRDDLFYVNKNINI